MLRFLFLAAVLVAFTQAAKKTSATFCTKYAVDDAGGGGPEGYYQRMVPQQCRAQHLGNWKPTHKIQEFASECPSGWRKYKENRCYKDMPGNRNFRDGEQQCNQHKGHIFLPNDRQEFQFVHDSVARHNKWYWLGTFCTTSGNNEDPANAFAVTGEDMRKVQQKLNGRGAHHINNHSHPCWMWHRNNGSWKYRYHHQHCHEGRGVICEVPLDA